jgi:hypothetical protein
MVLNALQTTRPDDRNDGRILEQAHRPFMSATDRPEDEHDTESTWQRRLNTAQNSIMSETLLDNQELRHVLHDYQEYPTTTVGFLLNPRSLSFHPKRVHNAEIPVATSTSVIPQSRLFLAIQNQQQHRPVYVF